MKKKLLEIFKPGTHTAMAGQTLSFSAADLAATIAAYDPAKHEAPLTVGHPAADAPAYGWVKGLSFADGVMLAEPDQVDADFAEMVNSGKFKKISASFYLPTAPNNPVPGVFYLRHVGFLGGQPPAVKGLKSASFSEGEEGVIEFGDWSDQVEAGLFRSLREWIIGKFSLDDADKALPSWDVRTVEAEAARPDMPEAQPAFAETPKKEGSSTMMTHAETCAACTDHVCQPACDQSAITISAKSGATIAADKCNACGACSKTCKEMKDQVATMKDAKFAERESVLVAKESIARHGENLSFAESLVREGKLLPALKEQAVAMLDFSAGLEAGQVVEFGEGEGKKSQPLAESFKTFLSSQPKIVEFGETAGAEPETETVNFSAPPGYTVDAAGLELHTKALAYQQKNPGTDYMVAVNACQ